MKNMIPILLLLLFLTACDDDSSPGGIEVGGRAPEGYVGPKTRILEDMVHSSKMNTIHKLQHWDFQYGHMYAYRRLFNHLNSHGYEHDRLLSGQLTKAVLRNYDIVFINLMDHAKPSFTQEEIEDVRQWVEEGGGLFVIGDHTNVYYSSEKINPLLEPFGISVRYETAIDVYPNSVVGLGWILVRDLPEHIVTEGIHEYSLQTGAPMDGPTSVGNTSPSGWGDHWNEESDIGFIGNWTKDEDEVSGPQSVAQAVTYGQGGVFVAGDQNMFGDTYLWFVDNGGLALNAFEWLAHRQDDPTPLRAHPPHGMTIHIDARSNSFSMGKQGGKRHYTFYCNLNRNEEITALSTRYPLSYTPDVTMYVAPTTPVDATSLAESDEVLSNDGQVVLALNPLSLSAASSAYLDHLGLDLGLLDAQENPVDLAEGPIDASPLLEVTTHEELRGAQRTYGECAPITCPGHALVSAETAQREACDLICAYDMNPGRFLLVLAGKTLRNDAQGGEHKVPVDNPNEGLFRKSAYYFTLGLTDLLLDY